MATLEGSLKKLKARQILSEDEMSLLLSHLEQIEAKYALALQQLRRIAEILLASGEVVDLFDKEEEGPETREVPHRDTQEILQEFVDLLNAVRHTPETDITDGYDHQIRLNRIAALAADAATLFEHGVAIVSPLRLKDEDEPVPEEEKVPVRQKHGTKRSNRRKSAHEA